MSFLTNIKIVLPKKTVAYDLSMERVSHMFVVYIEMRKNSFSLAIRFLLIQIQLAYIQHVFSSMKYVYEIHTLPSALCYDRCNFQILNNNGQLNQCPANIFHRMNDKILIKLWIKSLLQGQKTKNTWANHACFLVHRWNVFVCIVYTRIEGQVKGQSRTYDIHGSQWVRAHRG